MPCITRDPISGITNMESGFKKDAIKIKIYEGHDGEKEISSLSGEKPQWVKLDIVPVLAVSRIKSINNGLAKQVPVRIYFRNEERAYGIHTHTMTLVGNVLSVSQDKDAPDKLEQGGLISNHLMAAYLAGSTAAKYLGVDQSVVDNARQRFVSENIEEHIVDVPADVIEAMQSKLDGHSVETPKEEMVDGDGNR